MKCERVETRKPKPPMRANQRPIPAEGQRARAEICQYLHSKARERACDARQWQEASISRRLHSALQGFAISVEPSSLSSAAAAPPPPCLEGGMEILSDDAASSPPLLSHILASLGPHGPGLLAVTGIPALVNLRKALLPLARTLALLPAANRASILKDHGLGTDVPLKDPHRPVSSFATQLKFETHLPLQFVSCEKQAVALESMRDLTVERHVTAVPEKWKTSSLNDANRSKIEDTLNVSSCNAVDSQGLLHLGTLFRQLGACMVEVGLLVARLCDMAIHGAQLEQAILESGTAKGRLIHYHSFHERSLLRTVTCSDTKSNSGKCKSVDKHSNSQTDADTDLWQQWHFDYGIFTVLTTPMFLNSSMVTADQNRQTSFTNSDLKQLGHIHECKVPDGHIGLKVLNTSALKVEFVSVLEDCLIVQVGEAAQILTGGELHATAHCVCRPVGREHVSRETFVVFLQPSWQKSLVSPKEIGKPNLVSYSSNKTKSHLMDAGSERCFAQEIAEIQRAIPPLEFRWMEGCTFAEFSRQTTRQYYGVDGFQSRK
eukprot:c27194_g1_i1 orf=1434-3071(+)